MIRFMAETLGWKWCVGDDWPNDGYWAAPDNNHYDDLPDWGNSLDALSAKGGPVEYIREQQPDKLLGVFLGVDGAAISDVKMTWRQYAFYDQSIANPVHRRARALFRAICLAMGWKEKAK